MVKQRDALHKKILHDNNRLVNRKYHQVVNQ
jgi:hypothetical protein